MDKFSLYVPNFLPCKEYFEPKKNNACPGCGISLAVRQTYKAVESLIEKAVWEKPASGKFRIPARPPVGATTRQAPSSRLIYF